MSETREAREARAGQSAQSRMGEAFEPFAAYRPSDREGVSRSAAPSVTVWREIKGSFERVGIITAQDQRASFQYDPGYKGDPISVRLPVSEEPFTPEETASFFGALIPEGEVGENLLGMLRAEKGEYLPVLAELRDESIGALLLSLDGEVGMNPSYEEVDPGFFSEFAAHPSAVALDTMGKSRLSLSGAMAKVGLYRDSERGRWFLPRGSAPSNCIVKACDADLYPNETVNEALCMETARLIGLPVAECELIPANAEPLLAVARFDRVRAEGHMIAGLPAYERLHQEDLLQASGLRGKYAPTGVNYLSSITHLLTRGSVNAFGDAMLAVDYTMFDYLIGNCDNHLKNYSLLYSADWSGFELAPLYDVVNTTLYPNVYLEMGVPLCPSRKIVDVTRESMRDVLSSCFRNPDFALREFDELAVKVPGALEEARDSIAAQGFDAVRAAFDAAIDGVRRRASIRLA